MFPRKLYKKLEKRTQENAFRSLKQVDISLVDFSSNDYLGYAKDEILFQESHDIVHSLRLKNGATGSRLLSGNDAFHEEVEHQIADFHQAESALLYNSGYVANLGFFSSVPQRGDIVFYDELIHASIRDALSMSFAKSIKFKHNDIQDLKRVLMKYNQTSNAELYVVTEGVFSMDGDTPDILKMLNVCENYHAKLVVDEAHSLGVFGEKGEGLVQLLGVQDEVFARIMTYGKALGGHGASILGSETLKDYLINFSRSFIYTTALSPLSVAHIQLGYQYLEKRKNIQSLKEIIDYFKEKRNQSPKKKSFIVSDSAVQTFVIGHIHKAKKIANQLQSKGYDIKPILSPTVPKGEERLRITLHAYNTSHQVDEIFRIIEQIQL